MGWNSNSTSAAYQYDALDRLIDEQQGRYHNAYSYDANGNRLSQLLPDGGTKAYSYAPQSNRMTQNGGTAVRLDAAGNTLDDGKYQYRYDAADRLAEVRQGGLVIARYHYDYRGLRRQKITADGTTDYTYDTSGHLISQQTKGSQDNGQRDYLWTDTAPIARIDSPIGQAKVHKDWLPQALMGFLHRHEREEHGHATQLYYFHTDAMGTPRLATDAKQQVVWRWNEDAYGATVSTEQDRHGHRDHDWDHGRRHGIQVNLRYPGQYYDSETGLFYNWNRYYDPSTGRYATSDPIGLSGGVNTFGYVSANPLAFIDPAGEFAFILPALPAIGDAVIGALAGTSIGIGICAATGMCSEQAAEPEKADSCPVSKDVEPNHPDFTPHKKKKGLQKIPWDKNKKGFPDNKGGYWEPVPDGHKGTHDPHWDVQLPNGSHKPVYPIN